MTSKSFGNWVYERTLGSGGFGQVELWKEKGTTKRLAIKKCMLPSQEVTAKQLSRWKKEIEILHKFQHPNIVKAVPLPTVMSFDFPVLCMEFCNRGNLRKVLNEPSNACGLVQSEALTVMKHVSSALKYLHYYSITHRDLKPENVVLHETNNIKTYKLIDLGLAKELGNKTTTASQVGTLNYVAPELFVSNKYTCSVDYWSLGILFFEVLTGYKPFVPRRKNLFEWLRCMENKGYDKICANEIDGTIQFHDHVIHANDLSKDLLKKMVEWFRIALQWNPKSRGKRPHCNDNIFFTFLREIFPLMTIHVFSVARYQVDQFDVYNDITLIELQQRIQEKTNVPVNEQIIANVNGQVLDKKNNSGSLTLQDIPDSILYVYNSSSLEVTQFDCNWEMPGILDLMLTNPDEIKDQASLRQCYTSMIYIMRYEINLFRQYVLALGTNYDIIKADEIVFNETICKNLLRIESLLIKVKETLKSTESSDEKCYLINLLNKGEKVHRALSNAKSEIERFSIQMNTFFASDKLPKDMEKYTEWYEYLLNMFKEFENKSSCSLEYISQQIDVLQETYVKFDVQKETLLKDEETVNILRKLVEFRKSLISYEQLINASTELIPSYELRFSKLLAEIASNNVIKGNSFAEVSSSLVTTVTSDDAEIKDNIVLRCLLDEHLKNIQENWAKMKADFERI